MHRSLLAIAITGLALAQKPLVKGTNPPVVLLNGYQLICSATPVASSDTFGRLEQILVESGREVRFFDNCLQGRVSIERLGEAFGKYLGDLKYDDGSAVESVDLIGHSMGGLIARCYLAGCRDDGTFNPSFPRRVRKLVTIGTPHFGADFGANAPDLQAAAMIPGTRFLWDLATWNQYQDDLRGVDALGIIGRSKDRPGDGLVSALSASLYFVAAVAEGRTRAITGCHTTGIGGILLGCNPGERGVANIPNTDHPAWPLIRSFLAGEESLFNTDADAELSGQAALWITYTDNANTTFEGRTVQAALRDEDVVEPLRALGKSPALIVPRTRQRDTTVELKPEGKDVQSAGVTLGRGVKAIAFKTGLAITAVESASTEDGVYAGAARLLPSGGRIRMRGSSLDLATLVQLDGVALEIISQSTEDGIVVAVPERDPGIGVLTASNDAGAHSIRVVFGPAPARLLPGSNPTARWTAVAGASGYALWLGTGAGRSDLFEQRFTTALESDVPRLDAGRVYWRLWTLFDGEWSYRDLVTEIRLAANRPISTQSGSPIPW